MFDNLATEGLCCPEDQPYEAPPGYFDQPFLYVFDADDLTNGLDYRRLNITTFSGADFLLRRMVGQDRCSVSMQLYDVLQRMFFSGPTKTKLRDFVSLPEMLFPAAAGIQFDLFDVAKTLHTNGEESVALSQLAFQGVRRFRGARKGPAYKYRDDDYSYTVDIDINWLPTDAPRRFAIDIWDYDFELLDIYRRQLTGAPLATPPAKIQLLDQMYEVTSSKPVIDDLVIANSPLYRGVFPVPGTVYRRGQQIRFELSSLVLTGDMPATFQYRFHGVRRRPC